MYLLSSVKCKQANFKQFFFNELRKLINNYYSHFSLSMSNVAKQVV